MGGIEISFWRDLRGKAIGWLILSLRSPNQRLRKRRSLRRKRLPSLKRRKKSAVEFKHELGEGEERASTTRTPSQLLVPDLTVDIKNQMSEKRKKWEKKGKRCTKKTKMEISRDAEKLPYVHLRARCGQATNSHSLAEQVFS
ncbi:transcription factor bHLH48-like isoform X3 [Carya illinoinensis]|uniref:transcription factor bHLH48-like isoform X3 n=1 Tax=Carya illinoinensis TaxID=32201 RepID=UPI001C7279AB|nr:transcription factor bHLH48-like isoform X3 [Carya illinoinensis]